MVEELKKYLNASQIEAAGHLDGPALVIAGAGSGKTRVIEYRVLNLVRDKVDPSSILLLTFTRRASLEMLSRASGHDSRCKAVQGGTFHSFAYGVLKRYASRLGLSESFSVLDESDSSEAVNKCASRLGLFDGEKRFPKKGTLRAIISMAINRNERIETVIDREYPHFLDFVGQVKKLRKEYAKFKIAKNYMDYDDLLVYLKILLEDESVRTRLSRKHAYVMIDEYQDTNHIQGDIARLLAEERRNIMVVGDDAQSIYGFRGASHENIMNFPKIFPGCKIIVLEENYRSTQNILDVANSALGNMTNKYSKCLGSARGETGERPRALFFKDPYEEAAWIASRVKSLEDEGVALGDQAVLFRSAYVSIPLQAELAKRGIPYQVYGGLKFYEMAHVKDLLAHLRVIANPRDDISWSRVLMLIDGIGPKRSAILADEIGSSCASFDDIVENVFNKYRKAARFAGGLMRLASALGGAFEKAGDVEAQFDILADYYKPIIKTKFDDWHLRMNDLLTLKQVASRYRKLEELLADFAIESPERGVLEAIPAAAEDEKPLTLSTIHSAKGLEWDTVYFMGLAEGILPSSFALDSDSEIEEEHRLFYVGITRAKNNLLVSFHHEGMRGGITQFNKMSRFLDGPGVLSRFDTAQSPYDRIAQEMEAIEPDEIRPIYDKESLFRKVIDDF